MLLLFIIPEFSCHSCVGSNPVFIVSIELILYICCMDRLENSQVKQVNEFLNSVSEPFALRSDECFLRLHVSFRGSLLSSLGADPYLIDKDYYYRNYLLYFSERIEEDFMYVGFIIN